jgi:hypothetical protein
MSALTKEEITELEKAYARNKAFLWKSAIVLLTIELASQIFSMLKGKPAFRDFFLLKFIFFVWLIIIVYIWFFILQKIKKDLAEQGKLTFRTLAIRKGDTDELGTKIWGMRVEKNPYGIKFVKLSREAWLALNPVRTSN